VLIEIVNNKNESVIDSSRESSIILCDACVSVNIKDKTIHIPYENIVQFELKSKYFIEFKVLGKYNQEINSIELQEEYFRVLVACIDASMCFNHIGTYMKYHIYFNKFNLNVIEFYNKHTFINKLKVK
jgi:hypothetical protein